MDINHISPPTSRRQSLADSPRPSSSGSLPPRSTVSPAMPPPPPAIPYNPTKRISQPVSVLVPLSHIEIERFRSYRGEGVTRLTGKRKRAASEESEPHERRSGKRHAGDVSVVVEHYNSRPDVGVVQRLESPIIGLKNFNNWVKSVLITRFGHPVLQRSQVTGPLSGSGRPRMGRGKWSKAHVKELIGADIAAVSIDQARGRWNSLNQRFDATFAAIDCFPPARLAQPFDVVSMQFCMHYAFETVQKARCMLDNVSRYLRPGGVFIGTIPNADLLLEHLDSIPPNAEELSFGNSVYKITFENRERPLFGQKYWFFLQDAVENVPEYVVQWENFEQMASEYGLDLLYKKEFHQVFEEHQDHPEFKPLLVRMKVVDEDGASAMDEDQWEAASQCLLSSFLSRLRFSSRSIAD
ncbi:mRNA capping enzyme [Pholiota molesta]|nr:mRNA capping enzyme [Pholiota molesta]